MRKLTFIAGLAIGYVLGSRAGRERYEQLKEAAERLRANPALRNTVDTATQTGRRAAGMVADKAGGRLPGPMAERLRSVQGHQADDEPREHRAAG